MVTYKVLLVSPDKAVPQAVLQLVPPAETVQEAREMVLGILDQDIPVVILQTGLDLLVSRSLGPRAEGNQDGLSPAFRVGPASRLPLPLSLFLRQQPHRMFSHHFPRIKLGSACRCFFDKSGLDGITEAAGEHKISNHLCKHCYYHFRRNLHFVLGLDVLTHDNNFNRSHNNAYNFVDYDHTKHNHYDDNNDYHIHHSYYDSDHHHNHYNYDDDNNDYYYNYYHDPSAELSYSNTAKCGFTSGLVDEVDQAGTGIFIPRSGNNYFQVTNTGTSPSEARIAQSPTFCNGVDYTISLWAIGDCNSAAQCAGFSSVRVQIVTDIGFSTDFTLSNIGPADWQELTYTFTWTAGTGLSPVLIDVFMDNQNESIGLDDISISFA
ncbi:hypothetical protein AYO20_07707 [Fonsecaea nubica]|uniref:Uncharacterized protein n=1 Tax=Fonsecaea nubica TaxID=856822 RepID=A0A178CTZ8_9EURO|nr:hypothetical protein AYO20_07707 [Fonsecaea nubica]OAL32916.1 hypothetical protein AYO20_07707 [Fonsecaea nubica]